MCANKKNGCGGDCGGGCTSFTVITKQGEKGDKGLKGENGLGGVSYIAYTNDKAATIAASSPADLTAAGYSLTPFDAVYIGITDTIAGASVDSSDFDTKWVRIKYNDNHLIKSFPKFTPLTGVWNLAMPTTFTEDIPATYMADSDCIGVSRISFSSTGNSASSAVSTQGIAVKIESISHTFYFDQDKENTLGAGYIETRLIISAGKLMAKSTLVYDIVGNSPIEKVQSTKYTEVTGYTLGDKVTIEAAVQIQHGLDYEIMLEAIDFNIYNPKLLK